MIACTRCKTWMFYNEATWCINPQNTATYGILCEWCLDGWVEFANEQFIHDHL